MTKVGRLCRGCERWIEPYELEKETPVMQRLVVSGAIFSDDSARDALRGVQHSGVELAQIVASLFPRKNFLAFMVVAQPATLIACSVGLWSDSSSWVWSPCPF